MLTSKRDSIIQSLYNSQEVAAAINKMRPEELRDDLKQEIFLTLCEMDEAKLLDIYERNSLRNYVAGMISNMVRSDRSPFYKKYRREKEREIDGLFHLTREGNLAKSTSTFAGSQYDTEVLHKVPRGLIEQLPYDDDRWLEKVDDAVAELDPYEQGLIKLYADMGQSCKPIAQKTGIPERSIRFVIAHTREKLQNQIRQ